MNPIALWITGLPGCGKSTLAEAVKKRHPEFVILRVDELRKIVTPEPTYSDSERDMVYRCLVYAASTLVLHGHSVIIDATGNLRKWRELARQLIARYGEIYLKCPLEVCRERERLRSDTYGAPKDIYKKGKAGWPVPGVTVPYEEPLNPELTLQSDSLSAADAVQEIERAINRLEQKA